MSDQRQGYLLLLLPIVGWGLAPNIVEFGLDQGINALPFLAYRFLVSALLMSPYVLWKKQGELKSLLRNKWTWVVGISQTWAVLFQYLSQLFIIPSLSAIIAYSYMIIVPVVSVLVLQEKLDLKHVPIVIIAALGLGMITTEGSLEIFNTSGLGIALAILSNIGFAFYITSTARLSREDDVEFDSIALFYLIMIIVSASSLILSAVFQANMAVSNGSAWIAVMMLTVVSTILAYVAYIESLKHISANSASVFLLLQIVIPFAIDGIWFGRTYSTWILLGSMLIFAAALLSVLNHDHH